MSTLFITRANPEKENLFPAYCLPCSSGMRLSHMIAHPRQFHNRPGPLLFPVVSPAPLRFVPVLSDRHFRRPTHCHAAKPQRIGPVPWSQHPSTRVIKKSVRISKGIVFFPLIVY